MFMYGIQYRAIRARPASRLGMLHEMFVMFYRIVISRDPIAAIESVTVTSLECPIIIS